MNSEDIVVFEKAFRLMLAHYDKKSSYGIVVVSKDNWDRPLPELLTKESSFLIKITGWTREETTLTNEGLYVKTAFGESEYSKLIPFNELIAIFNSDNQPIIIKPYNQQHKTEAKKHTLMSLIKEHTLMSLIKEPPLDDPGVIKSMSMMKKNNKKD